VSDRGPLIRRSVDLATRKPWHVIAVWGVAIVVMGIAGLGAKQILRPENLEIAGMPSTSEIKQQRDAFGRTSPLMVLLEGPQKSLDRAGPRIVRSLDAIDGVSVSSPWSPGAPALLREKPNRALLIVTIKRELFDAGQHTVPQIRSTLSDELPPDIDDFVAGEARFSTELVDLVFSGAQKAELYAIPFLLLILLLIFRAPIAATIPLLQGVAVIVLTSGFVTLLGRVMPVNVLAQASGSIIGLALGVDYSLLFVARFRDELAAGASVSGAVGTAIDTAGRTVMFAGAILALAGLLVIAVTAGWDSMTTGSIGVVAAAVFSVLAAFTLLPASLALVGTNINRWPIGKVRSHSSLGPLVNRLISRPVAASLIVLVPLLFLCASALQLSTGGPDLKVFDQDNPVRGDIEQVAQRYGGGVMAPYEVLVKSKSGPITSPSDIKSLERFQRKLALDPQVKYVLGPGTTRVRAASDTASNGPTQLAKFEYGLGAASTGVHGLRSGLHGGAKGASAIASANSAALAGAQQIQSGVGAAADGAGALNNGLSKSASGSRQLDAALDDLNAGAAKIRSAVRAANHDVQGLATGSATLKNQLDQANNSLAQIGQSSSGAASSIESAKSAMNGMSAAAKSEPEFQSAYQSLENAQGEVNSQNSNSLQNVTFKYNAITDAFGLGVQQAQTAARGASQLSNAVGRLSGGINTVAKNSGALSSGLGQLSAGSGALSSGLGPLRNGASALSAGLGQASTGSGTLGAGLQSGYTNSRKLSSGLRKLHSSVATASEPLDIKQVSRSAYLTMALLSAAPPAEKQNLRLVLNEQNGGGAARIYLFTKQFPTDKSLKPFAARLNVDSRKLAGTMNANVAVGGPGQTFLDYDEFTHSRIWPLVAVLSLMSFLFLMVVFRSLLLAAKAVVLNMITVGAAMGVIHLLYGGDDPIFGGPGWMEATSFFVVYSTTFALSMDYEIFMISRMRESYLRSRSNEVAIREGVTKTAGIVTGSAAVMTVLFLAMALTSELISNAQMGLGLAVAITIDATIVRLILLPASMRLFGDANWYLPPWLDRLLPNVAIH
jgi:RND superfamily putative drug exporter